MYLPKGSEGTKLIVPRIHSGGKADGERDTEAAMKSAASPKTKGVVDSRDLHGGARQAEGAIMIGDRAEDVHVPRATVWAQ